VTSISQYLTTENALYVLGVIGSFAIGYATNVLAAPHSDWFRGWVRGKELRQLLQLGHDEVIVVLPHQTGSKSRRLPQVAVEDVLALRNVFDILSELGVKHPKIRHPSNLAEPDKKRNIITIGGSITNAFSREILQLPLADGQLAFVPSDTQPEQIVLKRGDSITYTSASYSHDGTESAEAKNRDIGLILRRPNPKNPSCSVVVLAGIRGIGTWGASDHLRKHARKLFARVKKDDSNAIDLGFLAVLDAEYENFDITHTRVKDISSVSDDA
jgi:hypothetical protein